MSGNIFLETERLILRQFTPQDADNLFELDSDPEVMRYINGGKPTPLDEIQNEVLPRVLAYYEQYEGYGSWAAIEKSSGAFIGWLHFRPSSDDPDDLELGYRLKRATRGKGYAVEGSRALIAKGFRELGVRRVVAMALATNTASIRVMEKAGLRFEQTFIEHRFHGDNPEAVLYALDKPTY